MKKVVLAINIVLAIVSVYFIVMLILMDYVDGIFQKLAMIDLIFLPIYATITGILNIFMIKK